MLTLYTWWTYRWRVWCNKFLIRSFLLYIKSAKAIKLASCICVLRVCFVDRYNKFNCGYVIAISSLVHTYNYTKIDRKMRRGLLKNHKVGRNKKQSSLCPSCRNLHRRDIARFSVLSFPLQDPVKKKKRGEAKRRGDFRWGWCVPCLLEEP